MKKEYTLKDLRISQIIAITFTILGFITHCIVKLAQGVEIPDELGFPSLLWGGCLPRLHVPFIHMTGEMMNGIRH